MMPAAPAIAVFGVRADALDDDAILGDGGARELRGVPGAWRLSALRAESTPR